MVAVIHSASRPSPTWGHLGGWIADADRAGRRDAASPHRPARCATGGAGLDAGWIAAPRGRFACSRSPSSASVLVPLCFVHNPLGVLGKQVALLDEALGCLADPLYVACVVRVALLE
jgi:hypothetical protein